MCACSLYKYNEDGNICFNMVIYCVFDILEYDYRLMCGARSGWKHCSPLIKRYCCAGV